MNLFRKGFILLFALLFPVIIFLFLKLFGENEYKLSIYESTCLNVIEDSITDTLLNSSNIKILDIRKNHDNKLIDNYIKKLDIDDKIGVITLSDQLRNLNWETLILDKETIDNLSICVEDKYFDQSFILLLDKYNTVRGYFYSTDRSEIERLAVEIDILSIENE